MIRDHVTRITRRRLLAYEENRNLRLMPGFTLANANIAQRNVDTKTVARLTYGTTSPVMAFHFLRMISWF